MVMNIDRTSGIIRTRKMVGMIGMTKNNKNDSDDGHDAHDAHDAHGGDEMLDVILV